MLKSKVYLGILILSILVFISYSVQSVFAQNYRQRSTETRTKIFGVVVGIVTDNQDPDSQGRIKVSLPWQGETEEGCWASVLNLMEGEARGTYFLPEEKDEVLIKFEHGDIRYPIVIGVLQASKDIPPSAGEEVSLEEFFVASGNALIINGEFWRCVSSLENAGPNDRVYVERQDDEGKSWIQFGDGVHGARLPSGRDRVMSRYRIGTGKDYPGVSMQKGKVAVDNDWNTSASQKYFGLYPGVVIDNNDPKGLLRMKVKVPTVYGENFSVWAKPCIPIGNKMFPSNGDSVWIMFEQGRPEHPVWMGTMKQP